MILSMIRLFERLTPSKKDYKTLTFCKFAQSIGAYNYKNDKELNIKDLLQKSFVFLNQDIILTKKQEQEFNIFKDRYNLYLQYCIENKFIDKNEFQEVESLNITTVPDMSKIEVPDITKELKEMDIDLDKLSGIFANLK